MAPLLDHGINERAEKSSVATMCASQAAPACCTWAVPQVPNLAVPWLQRIQAMRFLVYVSVRRAGS